MTRIGFTGHQGLTSATRRNVAAAISDLLRSTEPIVGLTSLAEGSDQIFALSILASGGQLHVVVPCQGYEQTFETEDARNTYTALLTLAAAVTILPFEEPSEDAYLAAGHHIAERCDILFTVWDGRPAVGKGGTGDVIQYARQHNIDHQIIWPKGAQRA